MLQLRIRTYHRRVSAPWEILEALGGLMIKITGSRYVPNKDHLVVNWGVGESAPFLGVPNMLNKPANVRQAINKFAALEIMRKAGVPVPQFTASKVEAERWNDDLIARKLLTSFGGRGATYVRRGTPIPNAPLYTRYVPKSYEYRIHVFKGKVIDVQQKKKKKGVEVDPKIRSYDNGWIYARFGVNPPDCVVRAAVQAVDSLGLDFGAVDIGYSRRTGQATVYEVNTAPGIEGTTLKNYIKAIKEVLNNKKKVTKRGNQRNKKAA